MKSKSCVTMLAISIAVAAASWLPTLAQEEQEKASGSERSTNANKFVYPHIKGHGKIVRLPNAADQPREGSKICVDVTASGPADTVNPAIAKVARFVNIYAGAGDKQVDVRITVILHGKATLTALSPKAYATKFALDGNPNLQLVRRLKEAGVEFLVCGQALSHKGQSPDDVAAEVGVAVSALTVNVNRQMDGYAFIPLP